MEKINYGGWPNCYRLSNDRVDLVVTTDVGPRLIRFGFVGQENEFHEYENMLGLVGGEQWRIYGGHRLWLAPEDRTRTYCPDNEPIELERRAGSVRLMQPTEAISGVQKEIDIRLSPAGAHVQVTHRLRNNNPSTVELAPWALSVMAPGGTAIIPLPPRRTHPEALLPVNTITLWAYTDMSDPRWTWGPRYVMLRQEPQATTPQKAGLMVIDGWAAYARNGHLFVKIVDYAQGAKYPDFGCSVEAWTDADMLELETLGPLARLQPGAAVEHVEHWFLFRDVPVPGDDLQVDRYVAPMIEAAQEICRRDANT